MSKEIIEATTIVSAPAKLTVTPSQRRQLLTRISDASNNIVHSDEASEMRCYAHIGKLTAMLSGAIPFEGMENYKVLPAREKASAKTYTAFFYAPTMYMREAKMCLLKNLGLLALPHAMHTEDDLVRRFRVSDITREAAAFVLEHNHDLFISYTIDDSSREDSGVKEEVVAQ